MKKGREMGGSGEGRLKETYTWLKIKVKTQ